MRLRLFIGLLPLLLAACAARTPAIERMDADALFNEGADKLSRGKFSDAAEAFERFVLVHPRHPRATEARYRLGEAYMGQKEYVTAALEFNRLASDAPAGPWADDARFMVCQAYYNLAPKWQLDQQNTRTAVDHCESLIGFYPDSEYVPRARAVIDELIGRLAQKEFGTAEYYYRRRAYDSANIYYLAVADNFGTTPWAPRALLRLYQTYTLLKYEQEAGAIRERLLKEFPDSPEAKQLSGEADVSGS